MEELVIVGGGVAGLSCLNALLDRQISPLLLEASSIGSPKMCGEFLAPSVIEQLNAWEIGPMQTIKQVQFNDVRVSFPRQAGAYARREAELELAARAKKLGGRIVEESPIKKIIPATQTAPYDLHLNSGDVIQARNVIFATGKFSSLSKTSNYIGFKTHVAQIIQPETLYMVSLAGGYLGIVPVTDEMSNITCLVKREMVEKVGSCQAFLSSLRAKRSNPGVCQELLDCFASLAKTEQLNWLEGPAPAFGLKNLPNWPYAYWIGDAFASVHPAVGYGFAHSVSSALLAVDYYLKQDPAGYHQAVKHQMRSKRIIGKNMHYLLQKPRLCRIASPLVANNPWISHTLLNLLGY